MPDLFQTLSKAPDHIVAKVAEGLEKRAKDPAQVAILEAYIADLEIGEDTRVLEVGCGTGPVCRRFAELEKVALVAGVEPTKGLVDKARELAAGNDKLVFDVADGAATGLPDGAFDIVVLHTLLSHVADQNAILDEAIRVTRSGGQIVVCDADFSKTSVAIADADPLQACVDKWVEGNVTDHRLIPKLPGLLKDKQLNVISFKGYSRIDSTGIGTGPFWIEAGADAMAKQGVISGATATALKAECKRRIDEGCFYALLPFAVAIARRA